VQNCEIGFQSGHVRDQSVICLNFGELDEGKGNKSIEHDRDGFEVHPSTVRKEGPASLTNIMTEHEFTRFCKDSSGDSTENNEFLLRNMGQSKRSVCDSPSTAHHLMSTPKKEEIRPALFRTGHPSLLLKKSEELKSSNSLEIENLKEPVSARIQTNKDENGTSLLSDIIVSQRKENEEAKKQNFLKRSLSKRVTISLPFDEFVDRVKGNDTTTIASNYPSYKIDKRLIFLGKEVDHPWHLISYHSTFRKVWELLMMCLILYGIFWYPLAVAIIFKDPWPLGVLIVEIVSIGIFILDIIINMRTTYSNDNNEEIIDSKMMRRKYLKSKMFLIDLITVLPIPEIILIVLIGSHEQWFVYSLVILVRMLRVFKALMYLKNRNLKGFPKLLRIFITFFLIVHWVSCWWYILLRIEFPDDPTMSNLWFPNNLRMVAANDQDLLDYYFNMSEFKIYGWTLLSVFMLVVGSDMAPVSNVQIWFSVLIGLFGAVGLAYIFATVTLTINRANRESSEYQRQLEDLKHKLKVNKVPHNLRVKIMEYFYYSWRKHSVLQKMDDFSELSIPLQRDIALYQHKDMILQVPLFKDLDPIEILSIVQKLNTSIYMPGDKIVREGERGTEMFFIQEGIAEMIIQKSELKNQRVQTDSKSKPQRILLEKGSYFGEVALMSNSKRTFDVNAFEFCILYTFSKTDYDNLKNEFKDIGPRLRSGLKYYKNTHMSLLIQILKNLDLFHGFTDTELQRIGDEYVEEIFVDPDRVVLAPKNRTNAIYVMLAGKVNCYADDEETRDYLSHLKRANDKDNWTVVDIDEDEDIDCLDDDILKLEKDKLSMEDDKRRLDLIRTYTYGEYFGILDFDQNEIKCDKYYVTDSGCQIGAITQSLKSQMAEEDPVLYEKLRANIIKYCPKRTMGAIEEESDSSFTTRNNTLVRTRLGKRIPSLNEAGKKPMLIKISSFNQNKEDDLVVVKDELQQLEDEMQQFKSLVSTINNKLNKITSNIYPAQQYGESSPEKPPVASKALTQALSQLKAFDKPAPSRELAKMLLGVDEVDQAEEAKSMRRDED